MAKPIGWHGGKRYGSYFHQANKMSGFKGSPKYRYRGWHMGATRHGYRIGFVAKRPTGIMNPQSTRSIRGGRSLMAGGGVHSYSRGHFNFFSPKLFRVNRSLAIRQPMAKARMSRKYMAKRFISNNRKSLYLAGGAAAIGATGYAAHRYRQRRVRRNYKGQFAGSY